ncbi:hypothetical protein GCM10007424_23380 [Flavobacterium suaedae]|uniref:ORC1/DEAH AAA+ ATPase domain-containing protein n=1 Tax=Flavobacterium suaedae TaxID=1767027 RepID=A0ABQ1K0F4_9FLAO|nr:ATP-binding protein [Flavobacterium suaedae]GGB82669.1 hypothetical protein GCM10007424_23380 [Flavobacterium suaedae]
MTTETKKQIIEAALSYMDAHQLSASQLATKANVNKGYLSKMLRFDFTYEAGGKQGDISAQNFIALANCIGLPLTKQYWEIRETEQLIHALSNLKDAKEHGATNVIIGETGSGKTFTIGIFAKQHPHDTFVVKVGSSDNLGDLIDKLIDALKITTGKTKSTKLRAIAKHLHHLKGQGYKPQIIFDESEYMKQPALCAIKELYDSLITVCSIVLVGTNQLQENIDKLRKRNKAGIPQFYRRIKFGYRALPHIDRSYRNFLTDIEDRALRVFLQKNCDNYGELHDALVPAMREADRLREPLTVQLVTKVLGIPQNMLA